MSAPRTPGPWAYLDIGEIVSTDPVDNYPTDDVICVVAGPEHPNADGNLIAAAPDMHQALIEASLALETLARRVFNDNGDHTINTEPLDPNVYSACYYAAQTVSGALAKARGEAA